MTSAPLMDRYRTPPTSVLAGLIDASLEGTPALMEALVLLLSPGEIWRRTDGQYAPLSGELCSLPADWPAAAALSSEPSKIGKRWWAGVDCGCVALALVQPQPITTLQVQALRFGAKQLASALALQHAEARATEATERYRALVDAGFEGICLHEDGRIIEVNQALAELFQMSRHDMVGLALAELAAPEVRERITQAVSAGSDQAYETVGLLPDGGRIPLEARGKNTHFHGRPVRVAALRDLRERKATDLALRAALREAEQASDIKSQFLANMSHEIRTPLNGVVGIVTLMGETPLDSNQTELLGLLSTSAESLLNIVSDILDISKIEAGKIELEIRRFAPAQLVESAVAIVRNAHRTDVVEVQYVCDPQVPERVFGDAGRIQQVLGNLLSNALKFTATGYVRTTVRYPVEGTLEIVVEDSGIGMDARQLGVVFDAYAQADGSTTRLYGGTGLGLPIARELAQLMGGNLTATSELGTGTRMALRLLCARAPEGPGTNYPPQMSAPAMPLTHSMASARVPPRVKTESGSLRVLVAEDNPVNRKIVAAYLRKLGHLSHLECDGQATADRFDPDEFDVALLDLQMPVLDGFGTLKAMREQLQGRPFPIFALTANAMSGDRERCFAAGFDGYLSKPLRIETLAAALAQLQEEPD